MYILFGIISSIAIMVIDFLILISTGFIIHGYSIFLFFPVAAIAEGMVSGVGIPLYLRKKNIKAMPKHYLAAILLAVVCFIGIYGLTYESTYVSNDMVINHSFNGKHISCFSYDGRNPINFITYIFHTVDTMQTSYSINGKQVEASNWGTAYNRLSFFLEYGGFILGSFLSIFLILGRRPYCDKCKKYFIEKKLYDFTLSDYNKEINELYQSLNDKSAFQEFISRTRIMSESNEPYLQVALCYCPECYEAFFTLKYMECRTKDDKVECMENKSKRTNLKVDSYYVKNIL